MGMKYAAPNHILATKLDES